jgi:hypothetical protein
MRIHGICVVKNEGDVMRWFLHESARWCDCIYVCDNGSTDGTWEIAQELAAQLPQVIAFRQDWKPFNDSMRSEVFNHFRSEAHEGDWWCRLDADEFYIDDPRTFLAALPRRYQVVWSVHLQFYLTREDLGRFDGENDLPEISAENAPRFYAANASEGRFFRHRARLLWPGGAWPVHVGLVAPPRIRLRHLQYRSPGQIQCRFATRQETAARGGQTFSHWKRGDWHDLLADPAKLSRDRGDGVYEVDEARLPRHLEPAWQRVMKTILHGSGIWP